MKPSDATSNRARSEPPALTFPTFELSFYDHPTDITKFTVTVKLDPSWPAHSRHYMTRQDMEEYFGDLTASGFDKSSIAQLGEELGHSRDPVGWIDTSEYLVWAFLEAQKYQAGYAAVHVDASNMSLAGIYGAQIGEAALQPPASNFHSADTMSSLPSFHITVFDSPSDRNGLQVAVMACQPNGEMAFGEDDEVETARKMLQDAVHDASCSLGKAAFQSYAQSWSKDPVEALYDQIKQVTQATISQVPQLHPYKDSLLSIDASRVTFADTVHPEGTA